MAGVGAAVLLLAIAMKKIAGMDWGDIAKAGTVIIAFGGIIAALVILARSSFTAASELGVMMVKIATAMLLMVVVLKLASMMDLADCAKGFLVMIGFAGIIAGLMLVTKLLGGTSEHIDKLGTMIGKIATAMLMMTLCVAILGLLSPVTILRGVVAITAFAGIIVGLIAATKLVGGTDLEKLAEMFKSIALAIGAMALVTIVLGLLEPETIIKGIAAVVAFSGIIVGLIAATKLAGGTDIKNLADLMKHIAIAIGVMAAAVIILGFLDLAHLAKGLIAVTILGAIVAGLIIVAKDAKTAKSELMIMVVAIGILAAIVAGLSFLDPVGLAAGAAAISLLAGTFAAVIKLTSGAKKMESGLFAMLATVGVFALILWALSDLPVESTLAIAASLSTLMLTLATVCRVMQGVPTSAATSAAKAILILMGVIAAIVAVAGAIALIPGAQGFVEGGGALLEAIGVAIGKFIGGIVGGIAKGISGQLPGIGQDLTDFMDNLQGFLTGAGKIKSGTMDNIMKLVKALMGFATAGLIEAFASLFGGGSSIAKFSADLVLLGHGLQEFSNVVKKVDESAVKAASDAAKSLAGIFDLIPNEGGVAGWLIGNKSLASLGNQLVGLGNGLWWFHNATENVDPDKVTKAADATKSLAGIFDLIPNEDGVAGWLLGNKSLASLGN